MPKVSVIIPVYNSKKFLNKCIKSIINQTLKDLEIIAVDDGSTDDSLEFLKKLSLKYPDKLKVYHKENGGAGSARNVGIDHATGEFIKFVDSDDYLKKDVLEKMYNLAKKYQVSLVRGDYQTMIGPFRMKDICSWSNINENKIIDVGENKNYIITETSGVGNKLISRELIGELRFLEKTKWEDLAIMPVIIAKSRKVYHMNEPVYNYRVHSNTTMKDFVRKIPSILDVIKCVDNINDKMQITGLSKQYEEQIENLSILHVLFKIENVMLWLNFSRKKKTIVISSMLAILDNRYPNWQKNKMIDEYKKQNSLFRYDMKRLHKYVDDIYRNVNVKEAIDNVNKAFAK